MKGSRPEEEEEEDPEDPEDPEDLFPQLTAAARRTHGPADLADIELDEFGEIVEPAPRALEEDGGEAEKPKTTKPAKVSKPHKLRPPPTPQQLADRAAKATETKARNVLNAEFAALRLNAFSKPTWSRFIFDVEAHLDHTRASSKQAFLRLYAALHPATKASRAAGEKEEVSAEAAWRAAEENFKASRRCFLKRHLLRCDNASFEASLAAYIEAQPNAPATPLERWTHDSHTALP